MMECKFILLADAANVSREGKLNITGEFNAMQARKVPFVWPMLYLAARFEASLVEGSGHAAQIKIVNEDGVKVYQTPPLPVSFAKGNLKGMPTRADIIARMTGLVFPAFGNYTVAVLIDGVTRGELTLYLTQAPEPANRGRGKES